MMIVTYKNKVDNGMCPYVNGTLCHHERHTFGFVVLFIPWQCTCIKHYIAWSETNNSRLVTSPPFPNASLLGSQSHALDWERRHAAERFSQGGMMVIRECLFNYRHFILLEFVCPHYYLVETSGNTTINWEKFHEWVFLFMFLLGIKTLYLLRLKNKES